MRCGLIGGVRARRAAAGISGTGAAGARLGGGGAAGVRDLTRGVTYIPGVRARPGAGAGRPSPPPLPL